MRVRFITLADTVLVTITDVITCDAVHLERAVTVKLIILYVVGIDSNDVRIYLVLADLPCAAAYNLEVTCEETFRETCELIPSVTDIIKLPVILVGLELFCVYNLLVFKTRFKLLGEPLVEVADKIVGLVGSSLLKFTITFTISLSELLKTHAL